MFKRNSAHQQTDMFAPETQLPPNKAKKFENSKERMFYDIVFCNIIEDDFACLYSKNASKPNSPVNCLVGSIILQNHYGWSNSELFINVDFNILTRAALGLNSLEEASFSESTFYNFQNRLLDHWNHTGENLLENVFDSLTQEQLKQLNIKTTIQRTDSFQALSNIREYSRVQLLVECVIRLERILDESDKQRFDTILGQYCARTAAKYVYDLKKTDIPHELEKLSKVYFELHSNVKEDYKEEKVFQIFDRVFTEHFEVVDGTVTVIDNSKLSGSNLQSPDDPEATYRSKNKKKNIGQGVNVCETAHPDNVLNLLVDIAVAENITDDSKILNQRIDSMKEKTPDLNELHTDAAYGSPDNDEKMKEHDINHVQTDVRGKDSAVPFDIEETNDGEYTVSCPIQEGTVEKTSTQYKACFEKKICDSCPYSDVCQAKKQKKCRVFYFNDNKVALEKRKKNMQQLPKDRQKIRPNVEATMKEFTKAFNHKGKLKIRGKFKTIIFAFAMGIAINFGRIFRHFYVKLGNLSFYYQILLCIFIIYVLFSVYKKFYDKYNLKFS